MICRAVAVTTIEAVCITLISHGHFVRCIWHIYSYGHHEKRMGSGIFATEYRCPIDRSMCCYYYENKHYVLGLD